MVFAIVGFVEAMGPRVAVIPVHIAKYGEVRVSRRGVGYVADEGVDERGVGGEPGWVESADYSAG